MNRYEEHGYRDRNDYLCSLADDYGVDEDKVFVLAELLGEVVSASTKENLAVRVEGEHGATAMRVDIAKRAKELNLDAIHDIVHEIGRDEARHGRAFKALLDRYFG